MATVDLSSTMGRYPVIDKRKSPTTGASPITIATFTASQSTATVDAALAAFDGTYWTQARLDATCPTDKLHALRLSTDSAGLS